MTPAFETFSRTTLEKRQYNFYTGKIFILGDIPALRYLPIYSKSKATANKGILSEQ